MVRVFPMPGGATKIVYRFGKIWSVVVSQTFCSRTPAMVEMAVHLRKSSELPRLSVCFTKASIQDGHLRRALPLVVPFVRFKAIRIFVLIKFAPVPTGGYAVGDGK